MKLEVDSAAKLQAWLAMPGPAIFQGLDLTPHSTAMAALPLAGCSFLGCPMTSVLASAAAAQGCLIIPAWPGLPFDAIPHRLYTPDDLYDQFDPDHPEESYALCRDRKIYLSYMDPALKQPLHADLDEALYRRLHDASVSDCLDEFLDAERRLKTVAFMGGHKVKRTDPIYAAIADLARVLGGKGYTIITGGGPGLMEAANLGAYTAGFANSRDVLATALPTLSEAPEFNTSSWLATGYRARRNMGEPASPLGRNVGIPTWFYGHEPANFFATHIAKYFENSVREEGLLAVAQGGVIFGPGAGGTTQEIFQDACQNYYRTYGKKKSPMILYPASFWAPPRLDNRHDSTDPRKPAYELLEKLAIEGGFSDYLLCTNDAAVIPKFLETHPPA